MEWLVGGFVLWAVGALFDRGSSNKSRATDYKLKDIEANSDKQKTSQELDEVLIHCKNRATSKSLDLHHRLTLEFGEEKEEKTVQIEKKNDKIDKGVSSGLLPNNHTDNFAEVGEIYDSINTSYEDWSKRDSYIPSYITDVPSMEVIPLWVEALSSREEDPQWFGFEDELPVIEDAFVKRGINSLWHMTHRNNVTSLLDKGILSNILAYKNEKPVDISNHEVQKWREKKEPIYNRRLHEYAPTYLSIKNPMLYVKRDIQDELCIIEISLSVLSYNRFIITDGNAASRFTRYYNSVDDLSLLPWDVIDADYWSDFEDGKRKKCAEVLVYPGIDARFIKKVYCNSYDTLRYLERLNVRASIANELFFSTKSTISIQSGMW